MRNKRGIVADYLPWLMMAVAVLAILFLFIFVLRKEGSSLIDRIKDLFGRG